MLQLSLIRPGRAVGIKQASSGRLHVCTSAVPCLACPLPCFSIARWRLVGRCAALPFGITIVMRRAAHTRHAAVWHMDGSHPPLSLKR